MSRYRMSDGTIVDTDNASKEFCEDTAWDGRNMISCVTGSQWAHQTLYRSRKGRYYVEHTSQWEGTRPSAEWVSNEEALRWLLVNNYDKTIPEELRPLLEDVTE